MYKLNHHHYEDPKRADRGWDWLRYEPFTRLSGGTAGRQPAGYAVGLLPARDRADPVFIPCGLLLMVGRAPALDHPRRRSVFVGYLSTAPAAALASIREHPLDPRDTPKRLGAIALDVAITHALNTGQGGRIVLHAAEAGGDGLLSWYTKQGMLVHPEGRHCYFTVQGALEASRRLDPLR